MEIENINPNVYKKCEDRKRVAADLDDNVTDPFDEREVFGRSTYWHHVSTSRLRFYYALQTSHTNSSVPMQIWYDS